jgi:simple sugar transport system permease protein
VNSHQGILRYLKFKEVGALTSLGVIFVVFGVLNPQFLSTYNLMTIFTVASELGVVTLGVNLVMIAG